MTTVGPYDREAIARRIFMYDITTLSVLLTRLDWNVVALVRVHTLMK